MRAYGGWQLFTRAITLRQCGGREGAAEIKWRLRTGCRITALKRKVKVSVSRSIPSYLLRRRARLAICPKFETDPARAACRVPPQLMHSPELPACGTSPPPPDIFLTTFEKVEISLKLVYVPSGKSTLQSVTRSRANLSGRGVRPRSSVERQCPRRAPRPATRPPHVTLPKIFFLKST